MSVVGGIDTHTDLHQAAVIDTVGRQLATKSFETTPDGYWRLLEWLASHGEVIAVGMGRTGSYGAELARLLRGNGLTVIEVDRPDRKARRANGKYGPVDAYAAATSVLSGRADGTPKTRDGIVESIRVLRVARNSAVRARTQSINQIRALMISAPSEVRDRFRGLSTKDLIGVLAHSRPTGNLDGPAYTTKATLRRLARRYQARDEVIKEAEAEIGPLVTKAAPKLVALPRRRPRECRSVSGNRL